MTPTRAYRRLVLVTLVATFLLVILGGVVRVSGSGLGCGPAGSGFHGWPLCRGDLVPGLDLNAVIEYAHRALAAGVGLAILALAVIAWLRYRSHRGLVRAAIGAFALVVAQGLLGAATVEENLEPGLVAAHLALAMLLLALLIYIWRASRPEAAIGEGAAREPDGGSGLRTVAVAAQIGAFLTILAGGYMAGTQNYGRPDYRLGDGAHHACGREFPTCNGELLPFGQAPLVDVHLTHRVLVYVTAALVLALVLLAARRRPDEATVRMAWAALGILIVQLAIGALNVWLEEYELLILAHLALATLLWGQLVALTLRLYEAQALAGGRAPTPAAAEPAAA